jgi:acyl-CoA hydrolase
VTDAVPTDLVTALRRSVRPGITIALGDGVGHIRTVDSGRAVCRALGDVAREVGDVRLVCGWVPDAPPALDASDFAEVVVLMPGWGARSILRDAQARYLPVSLAAAPALLAGPIRPDILITKLVRRRGSLHFATEVSWQRELIDAGVRVLAVVDTTSTCASAEAPIEDSAVTLIGSTDEGPSEFPHREPEDVHYELADQVLRFIPAGARVQYGPGQLGTALLRRCEVPLSIDTGLVTDAVVELDRRGKLVGEPSATYLIGSVTLYDWADGRHILRGIDHTHDVTRLSRGTTFISVNTAIEIDHYGQVNVEGSGEKVVGGIGGHPDFCTAGRLHRQGLSIIAVPASHNGRTPFVPRLSRPASTAAHDVDVVVTERGSVDLRRCDWRQRVPLLERLFDQ